MCWKKARQNNFKKQNFSKNLDRYDFNHLHDNEWHMGWNTDSITNGIAKHGILVKKTVWC